MIKRHLALLLLVVFALTLTGCAVIWGTDREHASADWVAEKREMVGDGTRHAMTHLEIILRDIRDMHRFWDRYFMNYDWDNPYID